MESSDDFLAWITVAAIFAAVAALYVWLFWRQTRAFYRAMIRLRDRIDRSKRW